MKDLLFLRVISFSGVQARAWKAAQKEFRLQPTECVKKPFVVTQTFLRMFHAVFTPYLKLPSSLLYYYGGNFQIGPFVTKPALTYAYILVWIFIRC
jgi:hypothetical protein